MRPVAAGLGMICVAALTAVASPVRADTVDGTVKITGTMTIDPSLPENQVITVRAQLDLSVISSNDASTLEFSVSSTVTPKRSGDHATYVLLLPYSWSVSGRPAALTLYLSAAAPDEPNDRQFLYVRRMATPANGATTSINCPSAL